MFCADYIASFIHHGVLVALWCELEQKSVTKVEEKSQISLQSISGSQWLLAGCLSGL